MVTGLDLFFGEGVPRQDRERFFQINRTYFGEYAGQNIPPTSAKLTGNETWSTALPRPQDAE